MCKTWVTFQVTATPAQNKSGLINGDEIKGETEKRLEPERGPSLQSAAKRTGLLCVGLAFNWKNWGQVCLKQLWKNGENCNMRKEYKCFERAVVSSDCVLLWYQSFVLIRALFIHTDTSLVYTSHQGWGNFLPIQCMFQYIRAKTILYTRVGRKF